MDRKIQKYLKLDLVKLFISLHLQETWKLYIFKHGILKVIQCQRKFTTLCYSFSLLQFSACNVQPILRSCDKETLEPVSGIIRGYYPFYFYLKIYFVFTHLLLKNGIGRLIFPDKVSFHHGYKEN